MTRCYSAFLLLNSAAKAQAQANWLLLGVNETGLRTYTHSSCFFNSVRITFGGLPFFVNNPTFTS